MNEDDPLDGPSGSARGAFSAVLDGSGVLHVRGELDLARAAASRAASDQLAVCGDVVRLDLAEVTFMDSCGVHVLAEAAQAVREPGRIL